MTNNINITEFDKNIDTPIFYQDINTNFLINRNGLDLKNIETINNQIYNIITTPIGTRPFEPTFGSRVPDMLFEPIDAKTAWLIETALFSAIEKWLYTKIRLIHKETIVSPDYYEQGFNARIVYQLLGTNQIGILALNLTKDG